VDRLDEVVELEADAEERPPTAMPLEVAAAPSIDGLAGELGDLAVAKR
jgi:hypothetical protein